MNRGLITGGYGNLGSIIYHELVNGFQVLFRLSSQELNLLDETEVNGFFQKHGPFDIVFHTAIRGGRRTRKDSTNDFYENVMMLENLLKHYGTGYKRFLNFDSGAIYDRSTNIYCRKEDELLTIPKQYYDFSKYMIFQRTSHLENIHHLRIFNIFHSNEEESRFIKSCILNKIVNIENDRYFDFFYKDDFIHVLKTIYLKTETKPPKAVNLSHVKKYKLSDIAKLIGCEYKILSSSSNHYCGDGELLSTLVEFDQENGMKGAIQKYMMELQKG